MADLDVLLDEARTADPGDRILYRDRIAARGVAAIPAMTEWLGDPRLGAFAVRVLERIADEQSNRRAVVDALESVDTGELPEHVAQDIAQAIARLGGKRAHRVTSSQRGPRAPTEQWPGHRTISPLELRFHEAMLSIFTLAGEATRNCARQLLRAEGTSDGFQRLTDENHLDLTVEALVLRPEFSESFTDDERAVAASRLARAGYQPPRG